MSHTVVGFSGHRHLSHPEGTRRLIAGALDDLAASFPSLVAITSVAIGADQLFANEMLARDATLFVVLPFPRERFKRDFSPPDWAAAEALLARAARIEVAQGVAGDTSAYMEAGVRVVDAADIMMVVWEGEPGGHGGTADVVAYTRDLGRPLILLDPATGLVSRERLPPPGPPELADSMPPRATLKAWFTERDATASRKAPAVRQLIQRIVMLHLLASVAGLAVLAFELEGAIAWAAGAFEVAVLGLAFLLAARGHASHAHWLQSRIEAEICRSFLATWPMRDHMPPLPVHGFDALVRKLRLMQRLDQAPAPPLASARDAYLDERVRHQAAYFEQAGAKAHRSWRRLTRIAMSCTVLAALMGIAHLVLALRHHDGPWASLTVFLALALPLASAALFSLALTQEYSRRSIRYREMAAWLGQVAQRLRAVRTWQGLVTVAGEVESALLAEAVEWQDFRRAASGSHG